MKCARCERNIPRGPVEEREIKQDEGPPKVVRFHKHKSVRSAFTGRVYCLRNDCHTKDPEMKERS